MTYKTPNGMGLTYGAAGDRDGNGWWAEMIIDTIDKGDAATGKSSELKLPRVLLDKETIREADRSLLRVVRGAGLQRAGAVEPGSAAHGHRQGRRRSLGRQFLGRQPRQDQHRTMETSFVPLPGPGVMQPYHIAVDKQHNAWLKIWSSDVVMRYDPNANQWATFDLPTRGTEARYVSLLEKDGKMEVVVPYSRTSKVAVMTFRSEADLAALKAQAERP